jgi:2,3-bisphosphoglycerate-independent phosphoglycerate mutase
MEIVDECVGLLMSAVREAGATMVVTADHGNLDMMYEVDKKTGAVKSDSQGNPVVKTSHTLSPVPWCVVGQAADRFRVNREIDSPGLGNIAAAIFILLGFTPPPGYLPALIELKN